MQEKGARIMPKTVDPITGEVKHFDYSQEGKMEAEQHADKSGAEVIPTYDAGGRVTKYYKSDGKWEKQHHFSKQQELSRERDIKKTARSIVGKPTSTAAPKKKKKSAPSKATKNITDIVKMVEAKEREAKRTHRRMKEIDKRDKK
jgi:hypothetical protein